MKARKTNGYSSEIARLYIKSSQPVYSLSTELEQQRKWRNNQPTDEIVGYRAWFTQEGLPPFQVKFSQQIKLPGYLKKIEFQDLEACEVRNNVYFRASDLKEVEK